jgi:hypothetical protein
MFHSDPVSRQYVTSKNFIESIRPENKKFWDELLNTEAAPSFDKFIENEMKIITKEDNFHLEPALIRRGIYLPQLERYYRFFPESSFLIFEDKELENDAENVLKQIEQFLEIPAFKWEAGKIKQKHHVRPYEEQISPNTVALLQEFYKPHNEAFFSHIGRRFDW